MIRMRVHGLVGVSVRARAHMPVRVCVCMYISVCGCMCACCMCARVYVHACACVRVCVCERAFLVLLRLRLYVCMCGYVFAHPYATIILHVIGLIIPPIVSHLALRAASSGKCSRSLRLHLPSAARETHRVHSKGTHMTGGNTPHTFDHI